MGEFRWEKEGMIEREMGIGKRGAEKREIAGKEEKKKRRKEGKRKKRKGEKEKIERKGKKKRETHPRSAMACFVCFAEKRMLGDRLKERERGRIWQHTSLKLPKGNSSDSK